MKNNHRAHDVERFDRWGSTYERSWMQQRLFDPVHSAILHRAESRFKPASLLDIGCGSGRLLRKVHDSWPEAQLSGSIRRKECSPSHASSPQRLASPWVPLRHCLWRMPRSIWRSRPSRFITGRIRLPVCVRSPECCDLVAPFFSLISPYPPGLHGCFHVLVFTVQRRCVRFLNRRVWMYRRSQLLFRALCASPSVRAPADD